MVAIIDYDAGNIKSVQKAIEYLGEEVIITREPEVILNASRVILPGVGAFGDAMEKLHKYNLVDVIKEVVKKEIPFLGICLGLQLLFETSDETPGVQGLGILKGKIKRIPDHGELKIPHIGWNSLHLQNNGRLFTGLEENPYVYFVHSYHLSNPNLDDVIAYTEYAGTTYGSAVRKGNLYGCQFHPEKSGEVGLQILKNFCTL